MTDKNNGLLMKYLDERFDNQAKSLKHIKNDVSDLKVKFENLDKKYITRREFTAVKWSVGAVLAGLGTWLGLK